MTFEDACPYDRESTPVNRRETRLRAREGARNIRPIPESTCMTGPSRPYLDRLRLIPKNSPIRDRLLYSVCVVNACPSVVEVLLPPAVTFIVVSVVVRVPIVIVVVVVVPAAVAIPVVSTIPIVSAIPVVPVVSVV
jgi:hypothetical protein